MSFVIDETDAGRDLVVTGEWSPEAARRLAAGDVDGLVLNYARGFLGDRIPDLSGLPITRFHMIARHIGELSPLYALGDRLTSLRVQSDPRGDLDLARLPELRHLSVTWSQVRDSLGSLQHLRRLFLLSYTEPDLRPLTVAPTLESISMKDRPRIASLEGRQLLPRLTELGIFLAVKLSDISALAEVHHSELKTLRFSSCRKIDDISAIANAEQVTWLEVSACGDIASAAPLANLTAVEWLDLWGSTRFLDPDLTAIANLPRLTDLRMGNRRHYVPQVPEIEKVVAARTAG